MVFDVFYLFTQYYHTQKKGEKKKKGEMVPVVSCNASKNCRGY